MTVQGRLRLSTQVLQELYYTLTRKAGVSHRTALDYLTLLDPWPTWQNGPQEIREAAGLTERDSLSFWDALIVVAAGRCGASVLYTEDLHPGQTLEGVRIVNPFHQL